jgi:hypothetical protein
MGLTSRSTQITRFESGEERVSMGRYALKGDAAVAVLRDPSRFRNCPTYFAGHASSTNEIIAVVRQPELDS